MNIGKLLAVCAVSASFGLGISVSSLIDATYKNHTDILLLKADALKGRYECYSTLRTLMDEIRRVHKDGFLDSSVFIKVKAEMSEEAFLDYDTDNPYLNDKVRSSTQKHLNNYLKGLEFKKKHPKRFAWATPKRAQELRDKLSKLPSSEFLFRRDAANWEKLVSKKGN